MIVKELEPQTFSDSLRRAGHEAESQLAHYLKRAFEDDPYKFVFNNLRIQRRDETAQLDHLILHRCGLIVVESKSVAGEVAVNEHGEWTRWWNRQGRGMPSPVLQARRQLDLLGALMQKHETELMEKGFLGLRQRTLSGMRRDVLVAISDGGRITRKLDVPEVVKADQVPDRIRETVEQARKQGNFYFTDTELHRVRDFLLSRHVPTTAPTQSQTADAADMPLSPTTREAVGNPALGRTPDAPAAPRADATAPASESQEPPRCRHCQSTDISIEYAHSYYIKCARCGGNTPIKVSCNECDAPARLRKKGAEFRVVCAAGHERLYHTNRV